MNYVPKIPAKEPEALIVTIKELEKMLSLSRRQIYRLISENKITPLRALKGKNFIFNREEILRLIKNK